MKFYFLCFYLTCNFPSLYNYFTDFKLHVVRALWIPNFAVLYILWLTSCWIVHLFSTLNVDRSLRNSSLAVFTLSVALHCTWLVNCRIVFLLFLNYIWLYNDNILILLFLHHMMLAPCTILLFLFYIVCGSYIVEFFLLIFLHDMWLIRLRKNFLYELHLIQKTGIPRGKKDQPQASGSVSSRQWGSKRILITFFNYSAGIWKLSWTLQNWVIRTFVICRLSKTLDIEERAIYCISNLPFSYKTCQF